MLRASHLVAYSTLASLLACARPTAEVSQATPAFGGDAGQRAEGDPNRLAELGAWAKANLEHERFLVPYGGNELQAGAEQAPVVTIVAFIDYQCPYCARLDAELARLRETYPHELRVVIKPMALSMHQRAEIAARAMLAAHAQGRGWAMHELLFENSSQLGDEDLIRYAKAAGVQDIARFWQDVVDEVDAGVLRDNAALAAQLGVTSTPSFFVNGVPQRGAKTFEQLRELYVAERNRVDTLLAAGARPEEVYDVLMLEATPKRESPKRPSTVTRSARPDPALAYAVPVDGRPTRGPDDALVTVIEFADFQCPYCRKVQPTLVELRRLYGDKLRVVYRHQPLPMHGRAELAARAAIAADRQGQFWAMHDALFDLGPDIAEVDFEDLAVQLGLDLARFRADLADPDVLALMHEDQELGKQFGAVGTPSFFINGRPLSGAQPLEAFTGLIDEELDKAKAFAKKHKVAGDQLYARMAEGWETEVKAPPLADHLRRTISTKGLARKGAGDKAKLTVIVCADFDCPFSARGAGIWNELLAMDPYEDQIAYYFAHFPLPMHADAQIAHQAAVAAGNQGKFWEMHDWLFAEREQRSEAELIAAAVALGLDAAKFEVDLHSQKTLDAIDASKALCSKHGTTGTPNYFINGRMMRGALPVDMVTPILDEELAGGFEQAAD